MRLEWLVPHGPYQWALVVLFLIAAGLSIWAWATGGQGPRLDRPGRHHRED